MTGEFVWLYGAMAGLALACCLATAMLPGARRPTPAAVAAE